MARPDIISVDNRTVADEWGEVYTLDRIDDLSIRVAGNPVLLRFSEYLGEGRYRWTQPTQQFAGGWNDWADRMLSGFAHFQLRNASPGSPGTVHIRAVCRGGN